MRKILSLFLILILFLGIFISCNDKTQTESSSEKEIITVKDKITKKEIVLSDEDAQVLLDVNILSETVWGNLIDAPLEYIFYLKEREFLYCATDGIFEHNGKSLILNDEDAGRIYAILEKYFSDIYFFPSPVVRNVLLSTEVRISYSDYCEIEDILQNAQWQSKQVLTNPGCPTLYHFHFGNSTLKYSNKGVLYDEENKTYLLLTNEEEACINAILEKYPSLNKK